MAMKTEYDAPAPLTTKYGNLILTGIVLPNYSRLNEIL